MESTRFAATVAGEQCTVTLAAGVAKLYDKNGNHLFTWKLQADTIPPNTDVVAGKYTIHVIGKKQPRVRVQNPAQLLSVVMDGGDTDTSASRPAPGAPIPRAPAPAPAPPLTTAARMPSSSSASSSGAASTSSAASASRGQAPTAASVPASRMPHQKRGRSSCLTDTLMVLVAYLAARGATAATGIPFDATAGNVFRSLFPATASSSRARRGAPYMAPRLCTGLPGLFAYVDHGQLMDLPGGGAEHNACLWCAGVGAAGHVGAPALAPAILRAGAIHVMRHNVLIRNLLVPGALRGFEVDLGLAHGYFANADAYIDYIAAGNVMGGYIELLAMAIHLNRPVHLYHDGDHARVDRFGEDFLPIGHGPPLLIAHVNGNHFVRLAPAPAAAGGAAAVAAGAMAEEAEEEEEAAPEAACACGAPDTSAMILCDACDEWWHYSCAGVTSASVPSGSWTCKDCAGASKKPATGGAAASKPKPALRVAPETTETGSRAGVSFPHTFSMLRTMLRTAPPPSAPLPQPPASLVGDDFASIKSDRARLSPAEWDATFSKLPLRGVGGKGSNFDYLSVQNSDLTKFCATPEGKALKEVIDGAREAAGPGLELTNEYIHLHHTGGRGLSFHADASGFDYRVTIRLTSDGRVTDSILLLKDKAGKVYGLRLPSGGYNFFAPGLLGVLDTSTAQHSAPASKAGSAASATLVLDFDRKNTAVKRATPVQLAAAADARHRAMRMQGAGAGAGAARPAFVPPSAGHGSTLGLLAVTVVGIASASQIGKMRAKKGKGNQDKVRAALAKWRETRKGEPSVKWLAKVTLLSDKAVEGALRFIDTRSSSGASTRAPNHATASHPHGRAGHHERLLAHPRQARPGGALGLSRGAGPGRGCGARGGGRRAARAHLLAITSPALTNSSRPRPLSRPRKSMVLRLLSVILRNAFAFSALQAPGRSR